MYHKAIIDIQGQSGNFYDFRVEDKDRRAGKFYYDCRGGDDGDWVTPVTIEGFVMVNFVGTIELDKAVTWPDEDHECIEINEDNIRWGE